MAGTSTSYSDAASSSASFTSGTKFSGLYLAPSRSTPAFLDNVLGLGGAAPASGIPDSYKIGAAVLLAALLAAVLLRGKK